MEFEKIYLYGWECDEGDKIEMNRHKNKEWRVNRIGEGGGIRWEYM